LISDVERLAQWLHLLKVSFDLQDVTASAHRDLFAGQGFGPDLPWWVPSSARRRVAENVGQGMTSETTKTEGVRGPHAEAHLIWSELKAGLELGI
jgi:hypothetical protein